MPPFLLISFNCSPFSTIFWQIYPFWCTVPILWRHHMTLECWISSLVLVLKWTFDFFLWFGWLVTAWWGISKLQPLIREDGPLPTLSGGRAYKLVFFLERSKINFLQAEGSAGPRGHRGSLTLKEQLSVCLVTAVMTISLCFITMWGLYAALPYTLVSPSSYTW